MKRPGGRFPELTCLLCGVDPVALVALGCGALRGAWDPECEVGCAGTNVPCIGMEPLDSAGDICMEEKLVALLGREALTDDE